MSATALLRTLFTYQAWAHTELIDALALLRPHQKPTAQQALRLLDHCRVVGEIFAAHLSGCEHGHATDSPLDTPALAALRDGLRTLDAWYLDFVDTVTAAQLDERLLFVFTDGDPGCMSRQEMLLHVAAHGSYHRGEIGQMLKRASAVLPWDTLAVQLHAAEPGRRARSDFVQRAVAP